MEGKTFKSFIGVYSYVEPFVLYLLVLIKYFIFLGMFLVRLWVEIIMPESCNLPVSLRIRQLFFISKDYSLFARLYFSAENMLQMHVFLKNCHRINRLS